ncbi:alpha/beta hydrolase [Aquabacter spiritensis]|uniref:Arylformamidase n=1 Tax=Aquabacter spiritensis TaxID=933073 RepID=A0A4R3LW39_9HYPH|nr:alpha/beta hydrolase [Aquabacter spiritensis]TCT04326.1 arylformamidase [Aquabacter spiritensis]
MDYEHEYNNRARVPGWQDIFADWARRSAAQRAAAVAADLGIPYGPSRRQILDIVWPDTGRDAPVALFIHGGYWQYMHPRDLTFVAAGCLAHGVAVALAGYDLVPDVQLDTIVRQARAAAVTLHHRVRRRIAVAGHSAGGHLAAALTATSWQALDARGPDDLVTGGVGIAGVYEVEPLVHTSMNEKLHLSEEAARGLSPALWEIAPDRTFHAFVGGAESDEFRRQSHALAAAWTGRGASAVSHEVAGANHFTVVEEMVNPDSAMVAALVAEARAAAARP